MEQFICKQRKGVSNQPFRAKKGPSGCSSRWAWLLLSALVKQERDQRGSFRDLQEWLYRGLNPDGLVRMSLREASCSRNVVGGKG